MFRVLLTNSFQKSLGTLLIRHHSSQPSLQKLFEDPRIHNLLRLITHTNPAEIHEPRFRKFHDATIKLLTDTELKAVNEFSSTFSSQRLQMPPVLEPRQHTQTNISTDPKLQGLIPANCRFVFTDITPDHSRKDRLIVVRESDGTLRHANPDERDRINQIYFPLPGRQLRIPMMFQGNYLNSLLDKGSFLYLLDRACVQFEPDSPDFVRICHQVYDRVSQLAWTPLHQNGPDSSCPNPLIQLRHTRHYGPLALYMIAKLGQPGGLVYEALSCQHYARLGWILRVLCLIRPESAFVKRLADLKLDLPPPSELDASHVLSSAGAPILSSAEIEDLLSYVEGILGEAAFYVSTAYGLLMHHVGGREWYSRITPYLILGALPLKRDWDEIESREHITHIISMLEPFEVKPFVIGEMDARARGIGYLSLPVRDFVGSPSFEQILSGIAFITECQKSNGCVYVHCKAGRTRSAFLVEETHIAGDTASPVLLPTVDKSINSTNFDHDLNSTKDSLKTTPESGGDVLEEPKPSTQPLGQSSRRRLYQALFYGLVVRLLLLGFSVWQDSARWPDGQLRFTDIDYDVFSDASRAMVSGRNLYQARPTYRYSPLIAAVLAPGYYLFSLERSPDAVRMHEQGSFQAPNDTQSHNRSVTKSSAWLFVSPCLAYLWGKFIFILADLGCAYLQYVLISERFTGHNKNPVQGKSQSSSLPPPNSENLALILICLGWLFNPVTAVVSVRGNADALQSLVILCCLLCISNRQLIAAGLLYGLCIHLRIYPIIYAPVIYLWLLRQPQDLDKRGNILHYVRVLLPNPMHFLFGLATLASLCGLTWMCYTYFGGMLFVQQAYLYHLGRLDFKHNFAPHFLPIYLISGAKHMNSLATPTDLSSTSTLTWLTNHDNYVSRLMSQWIPTDNQELPWWWAHFEALTSIARSPFNVLEKIFNVASLLPSVVLIPCLAFKLYRYRGLSWFSLTYAFVTFNKVCTSQYFMWSLALLPIALADLTLPNHLSTFRAIVENLLIWFGAQAIWLSCAYLLEMCTLTNLILTRTIWLLVWVASLVYFASNCFLLRRLISWRTRLVMDQSLDIRLDKLENKKTK